MRGSSFFWGAERKGTKPSEQNQNRRQIQNKKNKKEYPLKSLKKSHFAAGGFLSGFFVRFLREGKSEKSFLKTGSAKRSFAAEGRI